jgi:hypothetical protein
MSMPAGIPAAEPDAVLQCGICEKSAGTVTTALAGCAVGGEVVRVVARSGPGGEDAAVRAGTIGAPIWLGTETELCVAVDGEAETAEPEVDGSDGAGEADTVPMEVGFAPAPAALLRKWGATQITDAAPRAAKHPAAIQALTESLIFTKPKIAHTAEMSANRKPGRSMSPSPKPEPEASIAGPWPYRRRMAGTP